MPVSRCRLSSSGVCIWQALLLVTGGTDCGFELRQALFVVVETGFLFEVDAE